LDDCAACSGYEKRPNGIGIPSLNNAQHVLAFPGYYLDIYFHRCVSYGGFVNGTRKN
jgi:hypothetical protein